MNQFFIQGLQHPFLTPSHLILLMGLGIFLGQQGLKKSPSAVVVFIVAALISAGAHRFYPIGVNMGINMEITLLIIAAIIGILCALRLELPLWVSLLITLSCGLLIGQDSAPVLIPGIKLIKIYTSLAGSILSAAALLSLITLIALFVNKRLKGIPLRVLGSWIFASSVMVLAFQFNIK